MKGSFGLNLNKLEFFVVGGLPKLMGANWPIYLRLGVGGPGKAVAD